MFDEILERLKANGWVEDCPRADYWTFSKNNWECRLYWLPGYPVKFIRHKRA